MQYRRLGKSNLKVSALCLGTMMFADQTDRAEAQAIVADAREHGVNYIDTADVYSLGAAEAMVGDLLILCAYSQYSEAELGSYRPVVVLVDEHNRPKPRALQGGARP